jgi:hypothetical protein
VALVRSDVSEERITSIIRMERTSELGTSVGIANVSSSLILSTLMMETIPSYEKNIHGVTSQKAALFVVTAVFIGAILLEYLRSHKGAGYFECSLDKCSSLLYILVAS